MVFEGEGAFQAILRKILKSEEYCILSGRRSFIFEVVLSDIDIIVKPEDLPRLERSLLRTDGARLVNLLRHESTCYYFVLAVQSGDKVYFLPVDAGTDYRRDGRVWFSAEELLQGCRKWKDFWVASPEVEFKYLLVKKILKQDIPLHAWKRLQELADELGQKAEKEACRLLGNRWGPRVLEWLRKGKFEVLGSHLGTLKKVLKWERFRQDPLNPLRYWLPEPGRIWQRWRHPTGLWVAVLGPDGAGKSTLIGGLQQELLGAFRRTTTFHLMPRLFRKGDEGGPVTDPHAKPPRSLPASLLKLAYYWLDYTLGYWLKVRPALVRSTLVLFDRYYDDLLIDPKRYRYGGPLWLARWLRKFIPKPDLFIVLDLPPDIAHRRKPELDAKKLIQLRKEYLRFPCTLPNAYIVDASCESIMVTKNTTEIILKQMAARTMRRWNGSTLLVKKKFPSHLGILSGLMENGDTPYRLIQSRYGALWLLPETNRSAKNAVQLFAHPSLLHKTILKGWQIGIPVGKKIFLNKKVLAEITEILHGADLDSVAIYVGTPGAYRKSVFLLCQNGNISAVAKLALVKEADRFVDWEAHVLNKLSIPLSESEFLVPKVLSTGKYAGKRFHVTAPLPGKTVRQYLTQPHYKFCAWLYKLQGVYEPFRECSLVKEWRFSLDQNIGQKWPLIHRAIEWLVKRLSNKVLGFGWAHRDFAPWNMRWFGNKVAVLDWELAAPHRSPAYDLFHFVSIQAALKGNSPKIPWDTIKNWIKEHAKEWCGLEKEIYCAYLIDQAVYYSRARLEVPDVGEERVLKWMLWQLSLIIER